MIKQIRKSDDIIVSRFLYVCPEINKSKLDKLDKLQVEWNNLLRSFLNLCLERKNFKPPTLNPAARIFYDSIKSNFSSDFRGSAVIIIKGILQCWIKSTYTNKIRKVITEDNSLSKEEKSVLYIIGKCQIFEPKTIKINKVSFEVTQQLIDKYLSYILGDQAVVKPPRIGDRQPIYFTQNLYELQTSKNTSLAKYWLRISTTEKKSRIEIPLEGNPFITSLDKLCKTVSLQKKKNGRWCLTVVEAEPRSLPTLSDNPNKLGIDVGLNVLIATSNGRLYGEKEKQTFYRKYNKLKTLRASRQRLGLNTNSKRLDRLEEKLSQWTKNTCGRFTNQLVKDNPDTVFVVEDLDLSGCKGQKRFAYKMVHAMLQRKAHTIKVNPAYTSQQCPSCGYICRENRKGTIFSCKFCGRKSHADVLASKNILKRFEYEKILLSDDSTKVRQHLLQEFQNTWRLKLLTRCKFELHNQAKSKRRKSYPKKVLSVAD